MKQIIFCQYCRQYKQPKWPRSKEGLAHAKYCSRECSNKAQIGKKLPEEQIEKIRKSVSLSMRKRWQEPTEKQLMGIRKMVETRKKLYAQGKIKPWNKGIKCPQIGRSGELNGMYGKIPWNLGKNWPEETRKKISEKAKLRIGELNPNWRGGIADYPYGVEFTRTFKQMIRDKFGKCANCEISNEEHIVLYGQQLAIHHIDYNKNNNKLDNLIPLCHKHNNVANGNRDFWFKYYKDKILEINIDATELVSSS